MGISIHRLSMATYKLAGEFNPPTYRDTRMSLYAYLVVAGTTVILVDTGIGTGSRHIDSRFEPRRTLMTDALARFGLAPADVGVVINSHLHFDHCGNNTLFPHAEFLVQEDELVTARRLGTRYTVPSWFDFAGARLNPVRGDSEVVSGVTLLTTPGHTPGHQSVLIESDGARTVVAAQAAFTADEYRRGGDPDVQAHEGLGGQYTASISRLKSLNADAVLFSHDDRAVSLDNADDD